MATFSDIHGREWVVTLDRGARQRAREAGFNLRRIVSDTDRLGCFLGDPAQVVDLLYVVCLPRVEAEGLDARGFALAIYDAALDTYRSAQEALAAALIETVADATYRSQLRRTLVCARNVARRLDRDVDEGRLEPTGSAMDQRLNQYAEEEVNRGRKG